jgi:hypothetical protein
MQNDIVPKVAPFDEINQKIQRGEIQNWSFDPKHIISGDESNLIYSFITKGRDLYLVRGRVDPQTGRFLPPLEVP